VDYAIRSATPGDYDALCEIIEEVDALHRRELPHLFQRPPGPIRDRAYILELIGDENVGFFVAEAQGQLAGFVTAIVRDATPIPILTPRRFALVDNLAVRKVQRRAGIGRALMLQVHNWARDRGATSIELTVYEFNEIAHSFYQSLDYETESRRMTKSLE